LKSKRSSQSNKKTPQRSSTINTETNEQGGIKKKKKEH